MATVPEIITSQQVIANDYIAQAQAFLDRVANLANAVFTVPPSFYPTGVTDITKDAIDKMIGFRPVRPTAFGEISAIAPTSPVFSFLDIDQTLLDTISAKLSSDLTVGGYGIEPNDEAALWQRERDREAQNAMAQVDEVTRQFSQGGFSMPPGAMFAAQDRALQAAADKMSSVNRDIAVKRADLYFNARRFAIEQGSTVERILVELHRAVTEQANVMTALYQSQITKYRADIEGGIAVIRANVEIYAEDIRAFVAAASAVGEAYKLKVSELGVDVTGNIEAIRATLEMNRLNLLSQSESAKIRLLSSEFGTQFYGNTIAAALASVSTLAAQTTSS